MNLPWKILAVLAALGGAFAAGDNRGYDRAERHQAERLADAQRRAIENTNRANKAEAERLAAEQERDRLAEELEDAARSDPDASRPALGAAGVRRLNSR